MSVPQKKVHRPSLQIDVHPQLIRYMDKQHPPWQGNAALIAGLGIFRGTVGDSHFHTHWATQITIALSDKFILETSTVSQKCQVAIIHAGTPHRLQHGQVTSIYIDPASNFIDALFKQPPVRNGIALLNKSDLHPILFSISVHTNLKDLLRRIAANTQQHTTNDPRLNQTITQIQSHAAEVPLARDKLAAALNLSPSRFSHWFKEQTGIPLRSYKKWLKLRLAIEALLQGVPAVDAALIGGFTDQAHFSKSFSAAFGITVSTAAHSLAKPD